MEKGAEKRWKFYAVYAVYKLRNICHCPQGKPHSLCIHCSILRNFKNSYNFLIKFLRRR